MLLNQRRLFLQGNSAWMQILQLLVICQTNQRKAMQTGCLSVRRLSSVWLGAWRQLGGDWMGNFGSLSDAHGCE